MKKNLTVVAAIIFAAFCSIPVWALEGSGGGNPTGTAGGDLGGSYPNPTVISGANITGVIGKVNPQGTVASGGTLSLDLSQGNLITATVGGGAFTIAKPTNGVTGVTYMLQITSTADVAGTWSTGWLIVSASGTIALPGTFQSGPNGAISNVFFNYDGTNYQQTAVGNLFVARLLTRVFSASTSIAGPISNTSQAIATTSGNHTATTGNFIASAGGVFQATPIALASLTACAAGTEGSMGTQTNSTAACSAGATATSAGTTHCQLYCNGTNWIQTGR